MIIQLVSCNTGVSPGSDYNEDRSFAQILANAMQQTVQAPSDFAWLYSNGTVLIAPYDVPGVSWDNADPEALRGVQPNKSAAGGYITYRPQGSGPHAGAATAPGGK